MGPTGGPARMLCVPADWTRLQTGEARQRASGAEDPRHAQVIVRQVFINNGNRCYMNSLVQIIHWALHLSGADATAMGQGAAFFTDLKAAQQPVDLLQVRGGRHLLLDGPRRTDSMIYANSFNMSSPPCNLLGSLSGDLASSKACL